MDITQWTEKQKNTTPAQGIDNLITLRNSFKTDDPSWIQIASEELIVSQWRELHNNNINPKLLPLYGVPFAVKDNIDVLGFNTTAACPDYSYLAEKDAFAVKILKDNGAIVMGKTNLDQFATGLVGVRSPYGNSPNSFSDKHVSGGSSAGSASLVGRGIVPFSFGTDTAGSGRVPASLNNIIGLKPSRGLFSTTGVIPACKSLDCLSIFTLTLPDAQLLFSLLAKFDNLDPYSRHLPNLILTSFGKNPKIAIPLEPLWFGEKLNPPVYEKALQTFRSIGATLIPTDFSVLLKLAACLYDGPWVAERYSVMRNFLLTKADKLDPIVKQVVMKAENYSAADFFDYEYLRQNLLRQIQNEFSQFDALLCPTCPLFPTFDQIKADPIGCNSKQGTYTNFVNLADLSALAIPAGFRSDNLPFGITLISKKFNDYALLDLASKFLSLKPRMLGNTSVTVSPGADKLIKGIPDPSRSSTIKVAVVGAHLSGMPLNYQLQDCNAHLIEKTKTSPNYKLYALANTTPPKPGLVREASSSSAASIELEVYEVPVALFGKFVGLVPPPLAIGSVELEDGSWVKGFVCEEIGYKTPGTQDITSFGGWRKYIASKSNSKPSSSNGSYKPPFDKVLIANRGEIAVRIIRTLKKLGIKSVAVFAEQDRFAQHVLDATESVSLQGEKASETYLSIEKIINAAKKTGAQAIIPGYGFLAENADFATACENNDIIFVGPSAECIKLMGLKHSAREIAEKAKVPLVPGSGLLLSLEETLATAEKISYPVMLKSTAGGGGIGLQRCNNSTELAKAYESVKRLGQQYFNDSGVFLERFVDNARHVEVQVFGDGRGGAISLGERDCSLQRRNQKVVEETPAPNLPEKVRKELYAASERLVSTMKYKCAGTIEFIYDALREEFYFLEVNTRLQVEHPVTEEVTGLDLVEWMLLVAADTPPDFSQKITTTGASIEVRLYAENPVKDFLPSPGQIMNVTFPPFARVDTWITKGTTVSADFDPLIAKIIVYGKTRDEAIDRLNRALSETDVSGIITNIDYLRSITQSKMYRTAAVSTRVLDSYEYAPKAIEIAAPGSYSTVQDYPGRTKLWHIGVPPSGPMDDYAFRLANRIVGNHEHAPGIEATLTGPTIIFHFDCVVGITGGECKPTLDDKPVNQWEPINIKRGQKLVVGKILSGCRAYIAFRDGLDVPEYLGSRSTFALGKMGGFNGRVLKFGDVIFLGKPGEVAACTIPLPVSKPEKIPTSLIPEYGKTWEVGIMAGPHTAPDFFTSESIKHLLSSEWKIHYNSNRFGVRLIGPKPTWARKDGGEAGLHPSNAHDYVYAMGAINFTGDEPVILTCDGPSLGGFVCPGTVVESEMWKIGQVKPGDILRFKLVSFDGAIDLRKEQLEAIKTLKGKVNNKFAKQIELENSIVYSQEKSATGPKVTYRQAGDRYILVEYGENLLDLNMSYRVYELEQKIKEYGTKGIIELSPGVRSVLIQYDGLIVSQEELVKTLVMYEKELVVTDDWKVPSRKIRLPMAFEDEETLAAVKRYEETIRSKAPWLPNNVDFITKVSKLDSREEVRDMLYRATFLVLGLGDVFLGAPCAVPLDPRDRLAGTKYNPSRVFTPNGTVGLGGMYMCIYTMESPGGYQLVGRTIPIWDKLTLGQFNRPWLLNVFDQITFYPVTEKKLNELTIEANHGRFEIEYEDSVFDHSSYAKWIEEHKESIDKYEKKLLQGTEEMARLISVANDELEQSKASSTVSTEKIDQDATPVYGEVAGRFWKSLVKAGDKVKKGQGLIIVEAMKTEMGVNSPIDGEVIKVCHSSGDFVEAGDIVAYLK